jgi:hypothetical protein
MMGVPNNRFDLDAAGVPARSVTLRVTPFLKTFIAVQNNRQREGCADLERLGG